MSWLRRAVSRWLAGPGADAPVAVKGGHNEVLAVMASSDNPKTMTVTPISNGFLVMSRRYNPNGPDKVDATFAGTAEELTTVLIAELVAARMKT